MTDMDLERFNQLLDQIEKEALELNDFTSIVGKIDSLKVAMQSLLEEQNKQILIAESAMTSFSSAKESIDSYVAEVGIKTEQTLTQFVMRFEDAATKFSLVEKSYNDEFVRQQEVLSSTLQNQLSQISQFTDDLQSQSSLKIQSISQVQQQMFDEVLTQTQQALKLQLLEVDRACSEVKEALQEGLNKYLQVFIEKSDESTSYINRQSDQIARTIDVQFEQAMQSISIAETNLSSIIRVTNVHATNKIVESISQPLNVLSSKIVAQQNDIQNLKEIQLKLCGEQEKVLKLLEKSIKSQGRQGVLIFITFLGLLASISVILMK